MNINDDGGRKIEKAKGRYRWDKVKNSARMHTSWVDERKEWLRSMVRVWCMNYKGLDKERGSA